MNNSKENNTKNLYFILAIISLIVGLFLFLDGRIESRIAHHPAVIRIQEHNKSIDRRLDRIEKKIDQLLEKQDPKAMDGK